MTWLILVIVVILFILGVIIMEKKPKVNLVKIRFLDHWVWVREKHVSDFNNVYYHVLTYQPHLLQRITRIDSYNPRYIRYSGGIKIWSYHAYGQAFDLNPPEFPMATKPYDLPNWFRALAVVFKGHGFRWGGDWTSRFDPMHFEIGSRSEDL